MGHSIEVIGADCWRVRLAAFRRAPVLESILQERLHAMNHRGALVDSYQRARRWTIEQIPGIAAAEEDFYPPHVASIT